MLVVIGVLRKMKQEVADCLRDIVYAQNRVRAREYYNQFSDDYATDLRSEAISLTSSIDRRGLAR